MNVEDVRAWFKTCRRSFPWRVDETPDPYKVWISEVMLQQTQASRVVHYFKKWIAKFPTVFSLQEATLDTVLKAWEGLGYYSRARSIHKASHYIVENHGGSLPDTYDELIKIPGLGPYTVGAILSFGFHKKKAAVDANVIRVLTRYYGIADDISKPKTVQSLFSKTDELLPKNRPWEVMEALIELGALVCQKKAACFECPLKKGCISYKEGQVDRYPVKSQKVRYEALYREVCVIESENKRFLIRQGKEGIACTGLYEFPYFEVGSDGLTPQDITKKLKSTYNLEASFIEYLEEEKQSFTRYRVTLFPKKFQVLEKEIPGYTWSSQDELARYTFSSGHRRVLANILI